jgi:hypothetical protein
VVLEIFEITDLESARQQRLRAFDARHTEQQLRSTSAKGIPVDSWHRLWHLISLVYETVQKIRRDRGRKQAAGSTVLGPLPIAPTVFSGPLTIAIMGRLLIASVRKLVFLSTLYVTWFRDRVGIADPTSSTKDPVSAVTSAADMKP